MPITWRAMRTYLHPNAWQRLGLGQKTVYVDAMNTAWVRLWPMEILGHRKHREGWVIVLTRSLRVAHQEVLPKIWDRQYTLMAVILLYHHQRAKSFSSQLRLCPPVVEALLGIENVFGSWRYSWIIEALLDIRTLPRYQKHPDCQKRFQILAVFFLFWRDLKYFGTSRKLLESKAILSVITCICSPLFPPQSPAASPLLSTQILQFKTCCFAKERPVNTYSRSCLY